MLIKFINYLCLLIPIYILFTSITWWLCYIIVLANSVSFLNYAFWLGIIIIYIVVSTKRSISLSWIINCNWANTCRINGGELRCINSKTCWRSNSLRSFNSWHPYLLRSYTCIWIIPTYRWIKPHWNRNFKPIIILIFITI